ncbi:uncharacterized protein EI90DRAFT_3124807 [Cantharellus anzutake]|uniref:uncharacterized protein n=1 Tax=Cantharellus anzutake TaxID=1750568 RepID=UPI001905341C|nr:uncharacterized protein EI90DRAFT_3124807 [Cantharellus anzutake]KAF8330015.1 hypothetical protein EI90DRAFT_3124807 [Cantharellus anzutake]
MFSPLKSVWSQAVQSHKFSGDTVTKENFLEIYGTAHLKAFTKENILKAFQKSGIWPLNQDVVTPEMMWPSTMTSLDASSAVPVMLPSPVKKGMNFFCAMHECEADYRQHRQHEMQSSAQLDSHSKELSQGPKTPQTSQITCYSPYQAPRTPREHCQIPTIDPNLLSPFLPPSSAEDSSTIKYNIATPNLSKACTTQEGSLCNTLPAPPVVTQANQLHIENEVLREDVNALDNALANVYKEMQDGFDAVSYPYQLCPTSNLLRHHSGSLPVKADEAALRRTQRETQKKLVGEIAELRKLRAGAWEAAGLDNEVLLENWEVMKEAHCNQGEKPPQKPHVAMHAEVWALVTKPELEEQAKEDNVGDSECLGSSGEDGDSSEEKDE